MTRVILRLPKCGVGATALVLLAAASLLLESGRTVESVAAQNPPVFGSVCGSLGKGTMTCLPTTTVAVDNNPANSATITIAITGGNPAGDTITTALAADAASNICNTASGGGTTAVTLTCPSGLQSGATIAVTLPLAPSLQSQTVDVTTTVTLNANQAVPATATVHLNYPPTAPPGHTGAVSYAAGWNLVAGPAGFNVADGPPCAAGVPPGCAGQPQPIIFGLPGASYTYQVDDADYENVTDVPIPAGVGAFDYFPVPASFSLAPFGVQVVPVLLPPSHWVLIGNPGYEPTKVSGADAVYIYDPTSGAYQQTTTLQPGQGAWAYSIKGGVAIVAGQ